MALPPRTPCPYRMSWPAVRAVSWCSQAAMVAASSAPCIQARLTWGYLDGRCRRAAPSLLSRKMFSHRGALPVPVLYRNRLARAAHVQVGQDERVGVDRPGAGQLGERQGTLVRVQGAAPPGPRVSRDLGRVQRHPADQQPGVRRPPVRTVLRDRDLRALHLDRIVPGIAGDPGQQPPQRRDPPGADREADVRLVCDAGQRAGEVPGIGAQCHPAPVPGTLRQAGQGAAQQIRRGRARVIGAVAQVGGQGDLGLSPGGHVRAPDPLALMVICHAPLLTAVDLHVGSVQVDRDRPAGQRIRPRARAAAPASARSPPPGHAPPLPTGRE